MATVELVDADSRTHKFGHIRIKKIKCKPASFKQMQERFKKFRLNRLKSKLISDKEKLVSMEFKGSQLTPGSPRDKSERKLLSKTTAIAKLESKINFLETGNYLTEEFVNSRAIKLKDTMIKNLQYNRNSLYGVPDDVKDEIINGNETVVEEQSTTTSAKPESIAIKNPQQEQVDEQMREQQEQIAAEVQRIMAEDKDNQIPKPTPVPTQEQQSDNSPISKQEITDAVADSLSQIDVTPRINPEELAAAINEEMEKIKVSSNESSPAKVNKFINDDGTYRMKREDIDEDFRITRIDRKKSLATNIPSQQEKDIPAISPFGDKINRTMPAIHTPKKALTPLREFKGLVIEPKGDQNVRVATKISDTAQESRNEREMSIIAPDRSGDYDNHMTIHSSVGDIQAYMDKLRILQREEEIIDHKYEAAQERLQANQQRYNRTVGEFRSYVESYEATLNARNQSYQELSEQNQATEREIDQMISLMASGAAEMKVSQARAK